MSSAKAALESDTRVSLLIGFTFSWLCLRLIFSRFFFSYFSCDETYMPLLIQVLAFEAGRKHRVRVNTISAGTLINSVYRISLTLFLET